MSIYDLGISLENILTRRRLKVFLHREIQSGELALSIRTVIVNGISETRNLCLTRKQNRTQHGLCGSTSNLPSQRFADHLAEGVALNLRYFLTRIGSYPQKTQKQGYLRPFAQKPYLGLGKVARDEPLSDRYTSG
jgi:hypothetical protein